MKTTAAFLITALCVIGLGTVVTWQPTPRAGDIYQSHPADPFDANPFHHTKYRIEGVTNGWVQVMCLANGCEWSGKTGDFRKAMKEVGAVRTP